MSADWEKALMADVRRDRERPGRTSKRPQRGTSRTAVDMGDHLMSLMVDAADGRGISKHAYIRRAVAAFVAYDTGMDLKEVLKGCPRPLSSEGKRLLRNFSGRQMDDGAGFGDWTIGNLTDSR